MDIHAKVLSIHRLNSILYSWKNLEQLELKEARVPILQSRSCFRLLCFKIPGLRQDRNLFEANRKEC